MRYLLNLHFAAGRAGCLFVTLGTLLINARHFPAEYKSGASAAHDYLTIIKQEQDLDWTFLSPTIEMHQGTSG